ncbi:MAG: hypothetical protein ACWGOY_15025 [Anaerolineales bacterium]
MKYTAFYILIVLLLVSLTACANNPSLIATDQPEPVMTPTPVVEVPSNEVDLESLSPYDILVQQDYEPGFFRPEASYEFGRVPPFTLFADGTVIYVQEGATYDQETVMQAKLSPEETLSLLQQVLDYGFEDLESHTDFCQDQGGDEQVCVADAATTILRARLSGGELGEVKIYHDFANNPEAFQNITGFLTSYANDDAQPYQPAGATLFIRQQGEATGVTLLDWPLDADWLSGLEFGEMGLVAVPLAGEDLDQYLQAVPRNTGDAFFSLDDQTYAAFLVPWLPGQDFSSDIQEQFPLPENTASPPDQVSTYADCPVIKRSPDGLLRLAYLDQGNLWVWDEGTEPISLTSSGDVQQLRLAPSGEKVIFTRQYGEGAAELWAADLTDSTTLLLTGGSELSGGIEILPFSTDESLVAFTHLANQISGELWVAHLDGSGARRLVSTADLMGIVSEDLADSAVPAGVTWIPNTYSLTYDAQPTFESDGIYIFVQRQNWVVDAMTGDQAALLPEGDGGLVSYSPGGATMMINTPETLKFMNLETQEVIPAGVDFFAVGFGEYYAYPAMAWTGDSQAVLLAQPEAEGYDQDLPVTIWRVPVDGSSATKMLEVTGFFPSFWFSPELENVAYWQGMAPESNFRHLNFAALDGSQHIIYASGELINFIGWLPDFRHFLYVLGDPEKPFVGDLCGEPAPLDIDFYPDGVRVMDFSRFLFERPSEEGLELYEGHLDGSSILRLNIENSGGYDAAILPQE